MVLRLKLELSFGLRLEVRVKRFFGLIRVRVRSCVTSATVIVAILMCNELLVGSPVQSQCTSRA